MTVNTDLHLQHLGKYDLRELLGRGVMGETWKAFDPQFQCIVAIKILHEELRNDPDVIRRFWDLPLDREAQAIVSLRHPNIVHVDGFNISLPLASETSLLYIVRDYVDGPSLADYMRSTSHQDNFLAATDIVNLFASLASAIDYAHQQGVIHGNIKPANIQMNQHNTTHHAMGEPMLADIGISRLLGISPGLFSQEKPDIACYISPEQVRGQPANKRSDIYALGAVLYELLTGARPFQGGSWQALRLQIVEVVPPPPHEVRAQIAEAASAVIIRSLAKVPEERFSSATSLIEALAGALSVPVPVISSEPFNLAAAANTNGRRKKNKEASSPTPASMQDIFVEASSPPNFTVQLSTLASNEEVVPAPLPDVPDKEEQMPENQDISPAHSNSNPAPVSVTAPWQTTPATTFAESSVPSTPGIGSPVPPLALAKATKRGARLWKKSHILVIMILLLMLAASILATLLIFTHKHTSTVSATQPSGRAFFISSGDLYVNNNQGINDQVLIDLHNIPTPHPGKSYYAWLLGDVNQAQESWVFLGALSVIHGNVRFIYTGDQAHTNLLANTSRFLITEENANATPTSPFHDQKTWRYYSEISQQVSPNDANHFSMLNYLRNLLVQAPELQPLGLSGGLSIWLVSNIETISNWALSAKQSWETSNIARMRQLLTNILYYLDGECALVDLQGMARGMPLNPENTTISHITNFALVTSCIRQGQQPGGSQHTPNDYVDDMLVQLAGVAVSPGATPDVRALTMQLNSATNYVKGWLEQIRQDAILLGHMSDIQLSQLPALTLLSDLEVQARYAYAGRTDPSTGVIQEGATWIYDNTARLATFEVASYSPTGQ